MLRAIPGVYVRRREVAATPDVEDVVRTLAPAESLVVVDAPRVGGPSEAAWPSRFLPWQREGAQALVDDVKRGLLFCTGSGKTATALGAAAALGVPRVLVVTRAIGREAWPRDAAWVAPRRTVAVVLTRGRWSTSAVASLRQADRAFGRLRSAGAAVHPVPGIRQALDLPAWLTVVGWETLADHVLDDHGTVRSAALGWPLIIFDECHLGRGRQAGMRKAAHALVKANPQARVWGLTATLVRDRIRDIWAQAWLLSPRAWGTGWTFRQRYCAMAANRWGGYDDTGASNLEELRQRIRYWFDVRSKADTIAKLPPRRERIRVPWVAKRRDAGARRAQSVETAIAEAADRKADVIVDRAMDELSSPNGKVVLIGIRRLWVPAMVERLQHAAQTGPRHLREGLWLQGVSGEVPPVQRVSICAEYMAQPGPACLVATLDSVSESVDLQDTDLLLVAALPYTPGQLVQLEGRVLRLGGRRTVRIEYLIAEATIDEEIESALLDKFDRVVEVGALTEGGSLNIDGSSDEDVVGRLRSWLDAGASTEEKSA